MCGEQMAIVVACLQAVAHRVRLRAQLRHCGALGLQRGLQPLALLLGVVEAEYGAAIAALRRLALAHRAPQLRAQRANLVPEARIFVAAALQGPVNRRRSAPRFLPPGRSKTVAIRASLTCPHGD